MREWSAPALPAGWTTSGQPPFVARHEEVAALEAAWADAVGGAGRAVFLSGEPGSGKSRLVSEVCTRLRANGAAVLVGTCIEELDAPFEPFVEPLRVLLPAYREGGAEGADVAASAELIERVLERPKHEVAEADATGTADLADAADRATGQERVFAAVVDVLRAAAARRPLVLALEDLHWAGPAAVRLLGRVVEGTTDARVLLIGTLRGAPPDRSDTLADALASLARLAGVARIDLPPFTADEITDYVVARANVSREGAREAADLLGELTGGNPFLLRAMWRPVMDAERHDHGRLVELPDSVGDLVRSRIAVLDSDQRSVLQLAAVLGQEVELTELIGISEASVDVTLSAMDAAAHARLIDPPRAAGDRFRFPHAIARQAIIDLMPSTDVLRAHARIAQTLEARFPAAPRLIQRLAYHYAAARALGFGDRAVTYLARAAQLAEDRFAYEDAARLFERAAEISPDPDEQAELLLRAAGSWKFAADTSRAREMFTRVIETVGDPRLRLRAAIGFEDASWRPGLPGHQSVELLSSGLASIPNDDEDPLFIEALASLARATAFTGAIDEAERLGDCAVELARTHGDPQVLVAALRTTTSMTLRPRGVAERLERTTEFLRLTRSPDDEWFGVAALHRAANCYLIGDRLGMDESERDLVAMSRQWGRHWEYWVECVRFVRALVAGRLDDAASACRRAQRDESVFRSDATSSANAVQSYLVRRETGQLERVRNLIRGDESPTDRWAPGLLAIATELGLEGLARRTLAWLVEHSDPAARDSSDWPARLAFMAEAVTWLGDAVTAQRLHHWLEEYSGLNLMSGLFVAPFGPADAYLGELESLLGTGSPLERFQSALDLAERTDAPLHVARTLAATAAHLRREDPGSAEADALAERARAIAEPAGMVRVLRALGVEVAGVTSGASGPGIAAAASAREAPDGLTARELEVIALIAEGRSNRDIASRLVISEHTVANHVRNILTKIGAENRTQAARFAHEHGLA